MWNERCRFRCCPFQHGKHSETYVRGGMQTRNVVERQRGMPPKPGNADAGRNSIGIQTGQRRDDREVKAPAKHPVSSLGVFCKWGYGCRYKERFCPFRHQRHVNEGKMRSVPTTCLSGTPMRMGQVDPKPYNNNDTATAMGRQQCEFEVGRKHAPTKSSGNHSVQIAVLLDTFALWHFWNS